MPAQEKALRTPTPDNRIPAGRLWPPSDAGCGRRGRRPRRRNPVPVADPAPTAAYERIRRRGQLETTPGRATFVRGAPTTARPDPPWTAIGARRRDEDQMTPEDPRAATGPADLIYRAGAAGAVCWARDHRGHVRELPMTRWIGGPHASHPDRLADGHVLRHCSGRPTLDLGCGPGRFTASLRERGWAALGVDASRAAVDLTRDRGGTAIHADLFAPLPAEGCWEQILAHRRQHRHRRRPRPDTQARRPDCSRPAESSSPRSTHRQQRRVTKYCAGKPNIMSGSGFPGHGSTRPPWATSPSPLDYWSPVSSISTTV